MDKYTLKQTSKYTVEVKEDFIIDESKTTRKVFRALLVDNPKEPEANVCGYIIHQRKSVLNEWEDVSELKLNELKAGEGVKLKLSCSQLKRLFEIFHEAYAMANQGISPGEKEIVVTEPEKIIEIDRERKRFIQELLKRNFEKEVWLEIISSNPDLATKLAYSRIQSSRQQSLKEFKKSLSEDKDESYWQNFFEKNQWIFGYGLKYQFLHLITSQPNYGGASVTGKGVQKGDFLLHSQAEIKFTVLVEIKKPDQSLFAKTKQGEIIRYRNGVPIIHGSLTGAISQVQVNADTWEKEGSILPQNTEKLLKDNIFTHNPKGILVAGHSKQLSTFEKRKAFELFRRNLNNPEIVLFDELFERAKYIVCREEQTDTINKDENDDLPF